jgi:dUTP pyrophosphatase
MTINIKCKKLLDSASIPTRAYEHDAGWDLYSSERSLVIPSKRRIISTSISLAIPDGYVGLIWPRSGLAVKRGIDVFAGVIDSGYRGEIKVCLYNSSETSVEISKGDRIAQIIFHKLPQTEMLEVDSLDDSIRGDGGFGSSGV